MEEEGKYKGSTCSGLYGKLETQRSAFLMRARECSEYTIPTLIPPNVEGGAHKFPTPYQGVGARGVNNIASKLLLALMPANQPFFRLSVDNKVLDELGAARGDAEKALVEIEQRVLKEVNASQVRVKVFEALKHLIVGGNSLMYLPPNENTLKVYPLSRYVVDRDATGNVIHIITKESISPDTLDKKILDEIELPDDNGEDVSIYTHVKWTGTNWSVEQEIEGQVLESTKTTYAKDKCPFMALRLVVVDGEAYGRSYVEEYLGDIKSLEGLTKAIVEGSAAMAKLLIFVSPNGTTRKRTVAEAANLAVVEGNAQDVTAFRLDKGGDFSVALQTANTITERLSFAFMLNSAVQRQAERVTAEEIRYIANELEDTLGGVYSILGAEFQLPFAKLVMARMQKTNKIPSLPKGMVDPVITTGMEALGRQADMMKMDMFTQSLAVLGPEALQKHINISEYISRRAAALSIDATDLVKTKEELEQEMQQAQEQQQQAQMMQMAQAAAPNAVKGMADGAQNQAQMTNDAMMAEQQEGEPN